MKLEIPLIVCHDPDKPKKECKAAEVVEELVRRKVFTSYNPSGFGNCHEVTLGLLINLGEARLYTPGWHYVQGMCKEPQGFHSWLEYDEWAIDCSNGKQVFAPIEDYYRVKEPKDIKRFTLDEILEKVKTRDGKKELNIFDS
jgi:hypothetical protein